MTITKLIAHLRKLKQEHGDLWVEDARGILLDEDDIRHKADEDVVVFDDGESRED